MVGLVEREERTGKGGSDSEGRGEGEGEGTEKGECGGRGGREERG